MKINNLINRKKKDKFLIIILTAVSITLLDQLTKFFVLNNIIIQITYTTNTGAGFGILKNSTQLLIWFSIIILGLIFCLYDELKNKTTRISAALIIGGTVGNLIDRIRFGYVIDFIDLKIWPSFNIADTAITIGAVVLIIHLLKKE